MESVIPNMEKAEENYKVPNLEKGIAVLEYLSLHTQGETLQDIKSALDISQTTAYRILNTLVRLDYLIYNEDTKRYKLSRKLLTLGFRSLNEHNLLETVLPRLRDLRDQVKETACFGVLGDRKGIFIEQAQGHHTFRFILSPGKPFDLHCSAPGKAIMAYLPNTVRDRYLSYMEFTRYNARTITTRDAYQAFEEGLQPGAEVHHKKFGAGKVISQVGNKVSIRFVGEQAPKVFDRTVLYRSHLLS